MIPDPELRKAVARHLAGEASPAESERARAWLAQPGRAAADVDVEAALIRVKERFRDANVIELRPVPSIPERQDHGRSRTWIRAAAAAVIVASASLVWQTSQRERPARLAATAQSYETGVGETESVSLPDGSRVILAPRSRLTVAANYNQSDREVALDGEGWFEAKHDEERPFRVHAGEAVVRDIGTTFTVRHLGSDEIVVAVTAGSVVLHASSKQERDGVVLKAGDLGVLDRGGLTTRHAASVKEADTAFVAGRLVFEEANLDKVAAELARWYGVQLRIEDASIASHHVTASFNGEPVQEVLNVLGLALGARIELNGDTAHVRTRH
jgi:transmembrane sensor